MPSLKCFCTVDAKGGGMCLVIDVEDTGPGMTPEQAATIFSPFTQADSGMARRFGGSGLGLTISRRLALLMGGNVTLERTEVGKGSTFRLDLPLDPVPGTPMASMIESRTRPSVRHGTATDRPLAESCLQKMGRTINVSSSFI